MMDAETEPRGAFLTVRQAAFIGVGSMVGAGIFALLGAAGEVAGAAVWVSFLLVSTVVVLAAFPLTTLVEEPATTVTLVVIVVVSIVIDVVWKRSRVSSKVEEGGR
jgi:hypothetical protein